jgi:hypothetical protein
MNKPNTVTLWEVIYTIPYFNDNQEVIEELQTSDKFTLTDEQEEEFNSFLDDLRGLITGLNERDNIFANTDNGSDDADVICETLKVNPNHPTIVYNKIGNCKLNTYLYETI